MEMLARREEWDAGSIDIPGNVKIGVLEQDHFAYDAQRIIDTVMAGKPELWAAMEEKERLLAGEADDAVGMRLAELQGDIPENDGYSAEPDAPILLICLAIPTNRHSDPIPP